jgi:hypothetical protein
MKKFAAICIVGFVLGTAGAFADHPDGWGLGVVFGGGVDGWGPSLSLKAPQLPIFWAINLGFGKNYFGLGVSGDYYFIDKKFPTDINLNWYLGVGGYATMWGFNDDKFGLALGARVPVGLSWQFLKHGEIFLEIAPQLGLEVAPDFRFPQSSFFNAALGARFWF